MRITTTCYQRTTAARSTGLCGSGWGRSEGIDAADFPRDRDVWAVYAPEVPVEWRGMSVGEIEDAVTWGPVSRWYPTRQAAIDGLPD